MTRQGLHDALVAAGARHDAFDMLGTDLHPVPGDRYVLRKLRSGRIGMADRWGVYYSERGIMTGLRDYASADEACRPFRALIEHDGTAFDRPA